MARYSRKIQELFEQNPDKAINLQMIRKAVPGVGTQQIQNAMSRLKANDSRYRTVLRGKVWELQADEAPVNSVPARVTTSTIPDPVGKVLGVPDSEPEVTFKILGTTDPGDLILMGTSAGVSGVWIAKRVS